MKWVLLKDCMFHDDDKKEFITIKKGSSFNDVPYKDQTQRIKECLRNCSKFNHKLNVKFIALNCEGKQRVFEIGKSVIRKQERRIRRIKRHGQNTR
tara:strand:+ start:783 stop:1070 length:288 start_codon:yes stop_codon:yes gene_type:complete